MICANGSTHPFPRARRVLKPKAPGSSRCSGRTLTSRRPPAVACCGRRCSKAYAAIRRLISIGFRALGAIAAIRCGSGSYKAPDGPDLRVAREPPHEAHRHPVRDPDGRLPASEPLRAASTRPHQGRRRPEGRRRPDRPRISPGKPKPGRDASDLARRASMGAASRSSPPMPPTPLSASRPAARPRAVERGVQAAQRRWKPQPRPSGVSGAVQRPGGRQDPEGTKQAAPRGDAPARRGCHDHRGGRGYRLAAAHGARGAGRGAEEAARACGCIRKGRGRGRVYRLEH